MTTADLPAVNACLNGLAATLLAAGYASVRTGRITCHKVCMLAAFVVSTLFLACYVTYHALHGSTRFTQGGGIRWVYYAILVSHVVLAVAVVPLATTTLHRALTGRIEQHRRWARRTWPIWMYVSVTGVIIYLMLYRWFPSTAAGNAIR